MLNFRQTSLAIAVALITATPAVAQTSEDASTIEELYVYGEQGSTSVATKLDLSVLETPQTVTTISRAQLNDFALNSVEDVLEYTPGVTVEQVETNRTYYTARGFDIVNFQYDGVGAPFVSGLSLGEFDTAMYEKVEVVKGAAGLITGLANPSATINYVRKRPTDELQASVGVTVGEWDNRRVDVDVSGAMGDVVSGRVVVANETGDSYLDRSSERANVFYGVLAFDLSDSTRLNLGHSYDETDSAGVLWGALPLAYTNGLPTDYDVSTSTAPEWTYADSTKQQSFLEFSQALNGRWSLNLVSTYASSTYDSALFYVYGTPEYETEIGLLGWASAYAREEDQTNVEVFTKGEFDLFGQSHEVVVGYSYADINVLEKSRSDADGFPVLGSDWAQATTPVLDFELHDPKTQTSDINIEQEAIYIASRINVTESLAALVGARNTRLTQTGFSYGAPSPADADETVPYYGVTWEVVDSVVVYSSYSEVFKPQTWVNESLAPLGATIGDSFEVGIKKSFNNERATLTLANFSTEQENFGVFVGRNADNIAIYEGAKLKSEGTEVEFSGQLMDDLNIAAGYTYVEIEAADGSRGRPFIPKSSLSLSATYAVPMIDGLRVSGAVFWQDETETPSQNATQSAYTRGDVAVHYALNDNVAFSLNVKNVSDQKYLNSVYWDQGYYASPRYVSASMRWSY